MSKLASRVVAMGWLLAISTLAAAQPVGEKARARAEAHFQRGNQAFRLGYLHRALTEFKAGYELSNAPNFLINMGQCYVRLGEYEKAALTFQQFVDETPESDLRDRVAQRARDLFARATRAKPRPQAVTQPAAVASPISDGTVTEEAPDAEPTDSAPRQESEPPGPRVSASGAEPTQVPSLELAVTARAQKPLPIGKRIKPWMWGAGAAGLAVVLVIGISAGVAAQPRDLVVDGVR